MDKYKNIFVIGIKGVAMANLAIILKKLGKNVAGSDIEEQFITSEVLEESQIPIRVGFSPQDIPKKTDCVIYSASHGGRSNPQVLEAIRRGVPVISQAECIQFFLEMHKHTIGVCGCHGKTTVTSLLAYTFRKMGVPASYLAGVPEFTSNWGGDYGNGDYCVVEADEYGVDPPSDKTPKFHLLNPQKIICTNIDFDHPDVYKNLNEVKRAYELFFMGKTVYACCDDANCMSVLNTLHHKQYHTYGFSPQSDMKIMDVKTTERFTTFTLICRGFLLGTFTIQIFGEKNITNAAGVVLLLTDYGFAIEDIRKAIAGFKGAKRRFEEIYWGDNGIVFDDYAHHPQEIITTIEAARERFPNKRIIIIFQPHTFSRTLLLMHDFVSALSKADAVLVAPIFPSAREKKEEYTITSFDLEKEAKNRNIYTIEARVNVGNIKKRLVQIMHKGDMVFTMGAGDIYKLKDDIIDVIKTRR